MRKLLLTLAVLCGTVSGWAQESTKEVTFEVKGTTGVFGKTGSYSNAWGSSVTEENPYQLVLRTSGNNNINIDKTLEYVLINSGDNSGTGTGCEYFIEVPAHCTITGYSFKCSFGSDDTSERAIKVGENTYKISADEQLVTVTGLVLGSTKFVLSGYNKPVKLTNFTVTVTVPSTPLVLEDGYYTFQCAGDGNKKFANYVPSAERIVPVELGRYNGSVYKITRGEGNKYTIQTYDGKYVTYSGTTGGDNIKIKLPKDATDANKWWVIGYGNSTENAAIVPYQEVIFRTAPGFNYSVDYNGVNGALGFWDRTNGNSQWRIASACPPISYKSRIKCQGWYLRYDNTIATLTKRNAENLDENCIYTFIYGGDNKYTIQTSDGKYVTYNTTSANSNAVDISDAATDNNKWWVITPDFTGSNNFSTAGRVDIYPYQANISKSNAAFNLAKWVGNDSNGGIGLWNASGDQGDNSYCEIEPVIVEGERYVYIKSKQYPSRYVGVNFVGGDLDCSPEPSTHKLFSYEEEPNYKFCWKLIPTTYNETSGYYLYNQYYDWYAGKIAARNAAVNLAKEQQWAGIFQIIEGTDAANGYFALKCLNKEGSTYEYFNQGSWGGDYSIVDWLDYQNGNIQDGSWWSIEDVNVGTAEYYWHSQLQTERTKLNLRLELVGDGIGKYTCTDEMFGEHMGETDIDANASNAEKIKAFVYCLYKHNNIQLDINQPEAGFYRIKSMNGNDNTKKGQYVQNYVDGDGLKLDAKIDARSIMYIANNSMLSYASGLYVNDYDAEDGVGLIGEVGSEPTSWRIVENNGLMGTYALGGKDDFYLSDWLTGDRTTYGNNDANAAWTFEPVESLPVTITSAGYATFYCPVAVTLPEGEGLKAYYVSSTTNDKAQMTEITGVIPANTGVILEGEANTYNLTIGGEAESVTNKLSGTVASEYISTPSYVLSAQGDPAVVGFYKAMLNFTVADGIGTKVTENGTHFLNNGFKAYLPADGNNARSLVFDFGTETGIESIEGENGNVKAEIYDLAGRRVQNAQKGLYIVNGKKVIK